MWAKLDGMDIIDHYLTIRRWTPDFTPFGAEINKIATWVRLPGLPIEYYEKHFLGKVGDQIGKTLKVDMSTAKQSRGKFARLCIEIDLGRPLDASYIVNGKTYYVEYEGLHMIYFKCGHFGHIKESCTFKNTTKQNKKSGRSSQ
ncbi:hypothetical protein AHAS_Ahas14G0078600 [Arachis hypogaea]|uniref:Uncharacterized protein n=1 Tax=Arachis hypogaea TaxID=3818 RepID=A0A444ZDT7_ARAHY|nr:hypothetical protein Ahy_B04g069887 [Arachis hypogaea]